MKKRLISLLAGACLLVPAALSAQDATVRVHDAGSGITIPAEIYGQFSEHLGRCIYGGLWVGKDSPIPNIEGYRKDVFEVGAGGGSHGVEDCIKRASDGGSRRGSCDGGCSRIPSGRPYELVFVSHSGRGKAQCYGKREHVWPEGFSSCVHVVFPCERGFMKGWNAEERSRRRYNAAKHRSFYQVSGG